MFASERTVRAILLSLVLIGGGLRFTGLDRGWSDFVLPEARERGETRAFYSFNPDEDALIRGALVPFDPFHPPYTSYGMLPATLLRGTLGAVGFVLGWEAPGAERPVDRRRVYVTARVLAALASTALIPLAWKVGTVVLNPAAGLIAAFIVAFSAGAIQQGHFYIVDGLYALCGLAALLGILELRRRSSVVVALAAGVAIGLGMGVRLTAGLLGLVLALAVILREREAAPAPRWMQPLLHRDTWLAGAAAAATLIALQPYLITSPGLMWAEGDERSFSLAVRVGKGLILQPWSLVDLGVTPLVSHWLGGMPLAVGWPLAIGFLVAFVWALARGSRETRLVALWVALCFLPVGMLLTRAIRYVMPVVPPLAVLTGVLVVVAVQRIRDGRLRMAALVALAVVAGELAFRGGGMGTSYLREDPRIQAAREIVARVPAGAPIGLESGGFSMAPLISGARNPHSWLETSRLFYSAPYSTCEDRAWYLRQRLQRAYYLAIVDENRSAQYEAASDRFPVLAEYYRRLEAGDLGYTRLGTFGGRESPTVPWLGIRDPTFTAFDHPRVWLYRRESVEALDRAWEELRETVMAGPDCPDRALRAAVETLGDDPGSESIQALVEVEASYPLHKLATRIRADVLARRGRAAEAADAIRSVQPRNATGETQYVTHLPSQHYAGPVAARSLVRLGLPDLAVRVLEEMHVAAVGRPPRPEAVALDMISVASFLSRAGRVDLAVQTVELSLSVEATPGGWLALGFFQQAAGDTVRALSSYRRSLELDADQPWIRSRIAALEDDG